MEHRNDAPLADEPQAGAVPNDQPVGGGPAGPEDPGPASDVEVRDDDDQDEAENG